MRSNEVLNNLEKLINDTLEEIESHLTPTASPSGSKSSLAMMSGVLNNVSYVLKTVKEDGTAFFDVDDKSESVEVHNRLVKHIETLIELLTDMTSNILFCILEKNTEEKIEDIISSEFEKTLKLVI